LAGGQLLELLGTELGREVALAGRLLRRRAVHGGAQQPARGRPAVRRSGPQSGGNGDGDRWREVSARGRAGRAAVVRRGSRNSAAAPSTCSDGQEGQRQAVASRVLAEARVSHDAAKAAAGHKACAASWPAADARGTARGRLDPRPGILVALGAVHGAEG
jgi:hypothetical protein